VPLETQQQFAEKAKKIRTEIISIRKQLKKSEELFSSLVQGAFE
jgi:hypothetical protein